jgi:acetyl-CoA acetyltransferase
MDLLCQGRSEVGRPHFAQLRRIVNPVRTPVGAFGGTLRLVPVETLGGIVAKETLKGSGLDPKLV